MKQSSDRTAFHFRFTPATEPYATKSFVVGVNNGCISLRKSLSTFPSLVTRFKNKRDIKLASFHLRTKYMSSLANIKKKILEVLATTNTN